MAQPGERMVRARAREVRGEGTCVASQGHAEEMCCLCGACVDAQRSGARARAVVLGG